MLPIQTTNLEGIPEKYQYLYEQQGDEYILDEELRQAMDTSGLKNTNAALKEEKRKLKEKLKELNKKVQELQEQTFDDSEEEFQHKENQYHQQIQTLEEQREALARELKNTITDNLAKEIAGDRAQILKPHIQVEFTDDGIEFPDGMTREEYIESFKNNEIFAPVLNINKSQGAGASTSQAQTKYQNPGDYDAYFNPQSPNYSIDKQYELQQSNPELYEKLDSKYNVFDAFNPSKHVVSKN